MQNNIKKKATTSFLWTFVEKILTQGIGFVISLILARLLNPSDYGLIAMLSVFISVADSIIDSGFSKALIQKQDRTEKDFSTVFYCNIVISLLCYVLLYICAPFIANIFKQPLLTQVTRIYGLCLIVYSLSLVQKTRLFISYNFRKVAIVSTASIIISGTIAVTMAFKGYGVWSLVVYYLMSGFISSILLWLIGHWYPKAQFSVASFKYIIRFGSNLLGANLIGNLSTNLYNLIIGRYYSSASLGFFNRSQSIALTFPSNLSNIMTQASYPVFCELQYDHKKLASVFSKYIQLSFMLCAPIMTLLFCLSKPLVLMILTEKWSQCVLFIQIMSVGFMFDPLMRLNSNVINVTGNSKYSLYSEVLKKIAMAICLISALPFGLEYVVVSLSIYSFIDIFIVSFYVNKVVGISLTDEIRLIAPYVICCLFIVVIIKIVDFLFYSNFTIVILGTLFGFVAYLVSVYFIARESFVYCLNIIKTIFKQNH